MIYTALNGAHVEGTIWSPGPKTGTIWVLRPDGTAAVVNATKAEEVEYAAPQYLQPVAPAVMEVVTEILIRYRVLRRQLEPILGTLVPASPDHTLALKLDADNEAAKRSRAPYIEAHGGRAPISDVRFKKLSQEDRTDG